MQMHSVAVAPASSGPRRRSTDASRRKIDLNLKELRREHMTHKRRVQVPMLVAGMVTGITGVAIVICLHSRPERGVGATLMFICAPFVLLSALPTDSRWVRNVGVFSLSMLIAGLASYLQVMVFVALSVPTVPPCQPHQWLCISEVSCGMLTSLWGIHRVSFLLLAHTTPRRRLDGLARAVARVFAAFAIIRGCTLSLHFILGTPFAHFPSPTFLVVEAVNLVVLGSVAPILGHPRRRAFFQAFVASRGSTVVSVAGIASLFAGVDEKALIETADDSFRSVAFSRLDASIFDPASADGAAFALSEPSQFGEVDAFISHSWKDDGARKWEALEAWAAHFRSEHGREPRIWLDKACIDQKNIHAGLTCLPVFLAACQGMLCLRGKSYVLRLWCVVELFIFHTINPSGECEVRNLSGAVPGADPPDCTAFDISKASCTDQRDQDRLLAVIEQAAGADGLQAFNTWVTSRVTCSSTRDGMDVRRLSWSPGSRAHSPQPP